MERFLLVSVVLMSFVMGCSAARPGSGRDAGGGDDDGSISLTDSGSGVDAGPPIFEECTRDVTQAESGYRPIDIIWIIDNSGSMSGEAMRVQDRMNDFAAAIDSSGIEDYRVVVMTAMGFVNVPAPLGTDTMRFRFVNVDVQSNDGMIDLVTNYALYSDFLRPDAVTHFVVVTDDESSMGWMDFRTQMEALLGHEFTYHAIASPPGSQNCDPIIGVICEDGCEGPDDNAADNGDEYWALADATGGEHVSICTSGNWSDLFATLIAAIAVPVELPCRYFLPEPPAGMSLNRNLVNVTYTPSGATDGLVIPGVGNFGACGAAGGWYYEGDEIVVCPTTCSTLSADTTGRVDIVLGCATILI